MEYIAESGKIFDAALQFLEKLKVISVDTESSGLDSLSNKTLLLQLGNRYNQYVFDVASLGKNIQRLRPLLEDKNIVKILHNAKFDYKFIKTNFGIEIENIYDTMIAEQLLLKGRKLVGFGLDDVAEKYAGVKLDKTVRKSFAGLVFGQKFSTEQIQYAAEDVTYLEQIMLEQQKLIRRDSIEKVIALEMAVIQATSDMELNGMRIDGPKWLAAEATAKKERQQALDKLDALVLPYVGVDMFGKPAINYNSPKQLLPILQKAIPSAKITSTNENELKDINHPLIDALLIYRGAEKLITTYGEVFLKNVRKETGHVHTELNQSKTDTGRYSSNNPNLQNIPVKDTSIYREAFIAFDDDSLLVGTDYSNMELRILADLSKEPSWLEIFEKGLDMHCEIGTMLFGKPIRQKGTLGPNDPGENVSLRKIVKSINFGVGYGMGPMKLAKEVKVSFSEAKELLNKYWTSFPKIKDFFTNYVTECMTAHCIRSPYDNRLRWLEGFDLDSKKDLAGIRNKSMNFPMQSGNASITKIALTGMRNEIKKQKLSTKLLLAIHDEIIVNSHKDYAATSEAVLQKCMLDAAHSYVKNVNIKVESNIATYWKK
jgi:DNA polymerase-1